MRIRPLAIAILFATRAAQASLVWTTTTVDSAGDVGGASSLALDPAGRPAISYYDATNQALKYASYDGAAWHISTVDASVGDYTYDHPYSTSLVFHSDGHPSICYYDQVHGDLKYASFNGASWNISTIDNTGNVGRYPSMALDSNDRPVVSYVDAEWDPDHISLSTTLKYATFNGASWSISTVDTGARFASLALDANDHPSIAYVDGSDLEYASFDGASWSLTHVTNDSRSLAYSSLALDSNGRPAISYLESYTSSGGGSLYARLKYASFNGTTWTSSILDSGDEIEVGDYSSLAFGPGNLPSISYGDTSYGTLKYATFDGSSWHISVADGFGGLDFEATSLKLNADGAPFISYYDAQNGDLKFATAAVPEPIAFSAAIPLLLAVHLLRRRARRCLLMPLGGGAEG